jgi:hypothetical protein
VAVLCLAIWLPATNHCQLEKLPGLAFLECASDAEGQPDCEGDSCDVVERGVYKAPDSSDVAAVFIAVLVENDPSLVAEPSEAGSAAQVVCVCDETALLPQTWQSYSVLAVPIRGPSFLS